MVKRLHTKNKCIMRKKTKDRATYHLPEFLLTNRSITNSDCSNINNIDIITEKKDLSHKKILRSKKRPTVIIRSPLRFRSISGKI